MPPPPLRSCWGDAMNDKDCALFADLLVRDWRSVYRYEPNAYTSGPDGTYNTKRITDAEIVRVSIAKYKRLPGLFWYFIRRRRAVSVGNAEVNDFLDRCEAYMVEHGHERPFDTRPAERLA